MAWIWFIISPVVIALALFLFKNKNKGKKLRPGPKGFPIFGSLHLLGDLPHRSLHGLSQKYGPIVHVRLGLVPTIVVSSPQAAELFLKTHDLIFASRPHNEAAMHIFYGQKDLVFARYGSYWCNIRKMCTLELLSNLKVNSFKPMRNEELDLLINYLGETAEDHVVVDLSAKVVSLTADMSCLMMFGKKYEEKEFDERGFIAIIQAVMYLFAAPNFADFIPFIAAFDLQGLTRRMKSVSKVFDDFFERIIEEHLEFKDENKTKDFVDVMLDLMDIKETEYQIDRSNIKAIILGLLLAAIETSAVAVGWAMAELIKHPGVMKKVQDELEKVVGLDRMVEESDLDITWNT